MVKNFPQDAGEEEGEWRRWKVSEDKPEIDSSSSYVIPSFVSIEEVASVELETAEEEVPPESTATTVTTTARSTLSPARRGAIQ